MSNRAEAIIDLTAIAANVKKLKATAGTDLMAVVKADAYGHGLVPVAKTAISAGATWLGVALVEEAHTLRGAGITTPILAWLVPPGSDYAAAIAAQIDLAVPSLAVFNEIAATGKRARIHIEVDTGMTRGGFLDEWSEFLKSDFSKVEVVGIFSHFARADEVTEKQNQEQLANFNKAIADLAAVGVFPQLKHLANSAATITNQSAAFDLVRTGIAMYGLTPDLEHLGTSNSLGLLAAMEVRAKLHLVKKVPANSPVGYGATESTSRDTVLGVVAMGYADGIPRVAKAAGVFFDGKRCPIIGRVSMDQFVVDLGPETTAKAGDHVVIFNNGATGEFTAEDWGLASSSINYEITTRIGPRVNRIFPHEQ
jgi:alanine racemase